MSRSKWQDPTITKRKDRKRPWFEIRPWVPVFDTEKNTFVRQQKRISLGYCDEVTMTEAKRRKQEIMASINSGRFVTQAQLPFALLLDKYEAAAMPLLGARTQEKYASHIKNHIRPAFGKMRVCDIEVPDIQAWLLGKDLASATKMDLKNIMSAIFTAAITWKYWVGENPAQTVNVGRHRPVREKRLLSSEDCQRFMAALPTTKICTAEAAKLMVLTALVTGFRVSEILGLQWQDIDFKGASLTVRRRHSRGDLDDPKTEASKRTRQISRLAVWLKAFQPADAKMTDWIFQRDGEPIDDRDLQQHVFRPAAEAVGIYWTGFGMHAFRRVNITWRQQEGASAIEAMKAAGHSSPSTTWLYTLTDTKRETEQVDRITERLEIKTDGSVM